MFNKVLRNTLLALSFISFTSLAACSSQQTQSDAGQFKLQSVDSATARIFSLYLQQGDETILHGDLVKRFPSRGPIPGHVQIQLVSPDGRIFRETNISYIRRTAESTHSYFSIIIPDPMPPESQIRVTHIDVADSKMETTSVWRDVENLIQNKAY